MVEAVLALLHEGHVPDAQAAWGVDVLLQVATATANAVVPAPSTSRRSADTDPGWSDPRKSGTPP
ncbi:hypothetical protein ACIA74_26820 [Streptomyces sp. NPDC051658]|uniref:hypothetical protein n=1 Tax=Streptomyces sp. NPDC051658 TaxID=3365667 RepID=UPI0037B7BEA4